jgi:hypothetical protein
MRTPSTGIGSESSILRKMARAAGLGRLKAQLSEFRSTLWMHRTASLSSECCCTRGASWRGCGLCIFTEQTVYACSLARHGAVSLDADAYTIYGNPSTVTTGHYCGGGHWASWLYSEGLPLLSQRIGIAA